MWINMSARKGGHCTCLRMAMMSQRQLICSSLSRVAVGIIEECTELSAVIKFLEMFQ